MPSCSPKVNGVLKNRPQWATIWEDLHLGSGIAPYEPLNDYDVYAFQATGAAYGTGLLTLL